MSENHKRDANGLLQDGVRTDPVTTRDLMLYDEARQAVSKMRLPTLIHAGNPHEHLYIVALDGTGNDALHDREHITNIGLLSDQLQTLSLSNSHVGVHYEVGPGTQSNVIERLADDILGYSYDTHLENADAQLIRQVATWRAEDPNADIRILATGFSRGAEEAAGLLRLIDERGIQDPSGEVVHHHLFGHDTVTYSKPPLIPPGQVMLADLLLDPVGTGTPKHRDRQPPGSQVSGVQITALNESRNEFASSEIIPQGQSADGRFLGISVPGAHSDIGGGYHLNGLSTLNFNLAVDVINAYSDTPLLHKRALPQDPRMYVIHHSEDHMWLYRTSHIDHNGVRDLRGAQSGAPNCRVTIKCAPPDPLNDFMANKLPEQRLVAIAPLPEHSAVPSMLMEHATELTLASNAVLTPPSQLALQERTPPSGFEYLPLDGSTPKLTDEVLMHAAIEPAWRPPELLVQASISAGTSPLKAFESVQPERVAVPTFGAMSSTPANHAGEFAPTSHGVQTFPLLANPNERASQSGFEYVPSNESAPTPAYQPASRQAIERTSFVPASSEPAFTSTQSAPTSMSVPHQSESGKDKHAAPSVPGHELAKADDEISFSDRLDRMIAAADAGDWESFDKDTEVLANMPPGRDMWAQAVAMVNLEDRLAAQHHADMQQLQQDMQQAMQQQQHAISQGHGHSR